MSTATRAQRRFKQLVSYPLHAALIYTLYYLFKILPVDMASGMGGWIGRTIGTRLGSNRKIRRNLSAAMPELTAVQQDAIIRDMWDNLGRVIAEYPHLEWLGRNRVTIEGQENVHAARHASTPVIFASGHFANWEMIPVTLALQGITAQLIYRHANNPYVDKLLSRARSPMGSKLARKGVEGARSVHGALRSGGKIGMLVDQKHNRGRAIPFFGRVAMTAPAVADLALKYKAPIMLGRIERLGGANFKATLLPPMTMPEGPGTEAAIDEILIRLNAQLESWIRERPAQWLWLHRRWSD